MVTDDGQFEVVLIEKLTTLPELSDAVYSVLTGDFISRQIVFFHASEITIEFLGTPMEWTLDGEYGGARKEVTVSVIPKAIRIYAED